MNTPTLHPADRLRRSGDGNIALGKMAHTICDEYDRISADDPHLADLWLQSLCSLLGGMVEPVSTQEHADDLPSTGCSTCDAVLDTLAECHGMSLRGPTAADVAESARDWIGDLLVERDEARAEVERLRAKVASLRQGPDAKDDAEPDCGWEPGPWWERDARFFFARLRGTRVAYASRRPTRGQFSARVWGDEGSADSHHPTLRRAVEWCESQPEMADAIVAYISAPTVGAPDAGPDAPACDVEGDAGEVTQQGCAVPTAPGAAASVAEQASGADRISTIAQAQAVDVSTADAMRGPTPDGDARIVGPREGEDWIGMGRHAGTVPYGYDLDVSGDDPTLITHQEEADTMVRICRWRDEAVSAQTMAARLNELGRRSRAGHPWTPSAVRSRILSGYDEWREVSRGG